MEALEKIAVFRQRAADSEAKAASAQSENMRRAWLIVAREWKKMAEPAAPKPAQMEPAQLEPAPLAPFQLEPAVIEPAKLEAEPAKADEAKPEDAKPEEAKSAASGTATTDSGTPFVEATESKLAPDHQAELVDAVEKALRDWRGSPQG